MKYLPILIFLVTLTSQAQVRIKPEVARFFLEQNAKVEILEERDSLKSQAIQNLQYQIELKNKVISTYKSDSTTYESQAVTFKDELTFNREQLRKERKEVRKQKIIKVVSWFGTVIIIIVLI